MDAYYPPRMIFDRTLTASAYVLYGMLDLMAGDGVEPPAGGPVYVSNLELAERSGFTDRTITKSLSLLTVGGYIGRRLLAKYVLTRCAPPSLPPTPDRLPDAVRWEVWERDDFRCQMCDIRRDLTVDHITPRVAGGTNDLANLQTLCRSCNSSKGARVE